MNKLAQLSDKYYDLLDTLDAICEKIGYTEEISKQIENEIGSKKVSDCVLAYLIKKGFVK